ncbi:hypothetical protein [Sorangium sp. So ce362]
MLALDARDRETHRVLDSDAGQIGEGGEGARSPLDVLRGAAQGERHLVPR